MSLVKWIAVVGGKQYSFSFKDMPYGADMGEGLDYFLDEIYDGGPEGNDWDADAMSCFAGAFEDVSEHPSR